MHIAYKYRIYPNKLQRLYLARHFGAARFVFNHFLAKRKDDYERDKKSSSAYADMKLLTAMKATDELVWMKEMASHILREPVFNLDAAYKNFFERRSRFPKFKKRSNTQCIKIPDGFHIEDCHLWLPKLKSGIRLKQHRPTEGRMLFVHVSKTPTDKYYVSITCEVEQIAQQPKTDITIGIDLGIRTLITASDGTIIDNPKAYAKAEKKLQFKHKLLSRKQKGSNRRNRARLRLALAYERVSDIRKDAIHKASKQLVNENQVIIAETLAVRNMLRCRNMGKSISDASWGELIRQLGYKSEWFGRTFHKIDRWFPSSKTCNACGTINEELKRDDYEWDCPACKTHHDRDINAALNIRDKGLEDLKRLATERSSDGKQKCVEALAAGIISTSQDGGMMVSRVVETQCDIGS